MEKTCTRFAQVLLGGTMFIVARQHGMATGACGFLKMQRESFHRKAHQRVFVWVRGGFMAVVTRTSGGSSKIF